MELVKKVVRLTFYSLAVIVGAGLYAADLFVKFVPAGAVLSSFTADRAARRAEHWNPSDSLGRDRFQAPPGFQPENLEQPKFNVGDRARVYSY